MLIPHNSIRPVRIRLSVTLLLLGAFCWTTLTISAGYLYSRHIDYLRMKTDNSLMKVKVMLFAQEIKKSQEILEQVRENDDQLRNLLDLKSKKAIIEQEACGGPTAADAGDLERVLRGKVYEMSADDIARQTAALQEESRRRIDSSREILTHVRRERAVFQAMPSIWPCSGRITSSFGFRIHPLLASTELHTGIDIANQKNTPIRATSDGTVKVASWQPGYGRMILLDHGFSYATLYGHMCSLMVEVGQKVRRGQVIGYMGSTGTSTGNHLHYEVRFKNSPVNAARFLRKTLEQMTVNS